MQNITLSSCHFPMNTTASSIFSSTGGPFSLNLIPQCSEAALTHLSLYKMAAILQTICSNALSWMKMLEFRFNFHWNLFVRVQLAISQHWFRYALTPNRLTWFTDEYMRHLGKWVNTWRQRQNGCHFAVSVSELNLLYEIYNFEFILHWNLSQGFKQQWDIIGSDKWIDVEHRVLSTWEEYPATNKETDRLPTSLPPWNIVCLIAATQF